MNLGRDPRWGRFQESVRLIACGFWSHLCKVAERSRCGQVSEDPHLNGMYSASLLQGFQGDDPHHLGVAATCKHFVGYSLEGGPAADGFSRHDFNAIISQQDLAESYLPGFKACVTLGQPAQIMCSCKLRRSLCTASTRSVCLLTEPVAIDNAVNGIPSCLHKDLLTDLVRKEWGFEGLIVSDQDSIRDAWAGTNQTGHTGHFYGNSFANVSALGIRAGCDQNDGRTYADSAMDAVNAGLLTEGDVDKALSNILMQRFRVGAFDPKASVSFRDIPIDVLDSPEHRSSALQAAREAITLLANVNDTLPLDKSATLKVGVVGPFADYPTSLAGGKPDYHPSFEITPLEGIRAMVSSFGGPEVAYAPGSAVSKQDPEDLEPALAVARGSDVLVVCVGIDATIEHESMDRTQIGLPQAQLQMLQAVVQASRSGAKVIVMLSNGGPLSIDWLKSTLQQPTPAVGAVVEAYELGQSAGTVVAEVLWGETNPSGVLPFSLFPEDYVNQVSLTNMSMRPGHRNPGRTYRFYTGVPLWPFGHSMSFTRFVISADGQEEELMSSTTDRADEFSMAVSVRNVGERRGSKTVMAFVESKDPSAPRASLWSIRKVSLSPGESQALEFHAADNDWSAPTCVLATMPD